MPLGERAYKLCNNGKVETEIHFVMECSKLLNLQNVLFCIIVKKPNLYDIVDRVFCTCF